MAQEISNEGETFFNVDSRLLFELGEKLVTNRAVALAELVKNAYDADATYIEISMKNIKKPGGTIKIKDDGQGMTLSTFKRTWMRIATIDKEENPISEKYKRKKAGEKGIGRFACRRLSKKLKMMSVAETEDGTKEELTATFEWPNFTPGSDVNEIPVEYSVKTVDEGTPTGTTLILKNTNDAWTAWDIRRLRKELAEYISPTTFEPERRLEEPPEKYDPGFRIKKFYCPEFPGKAMRLDKTFFRNAWAKLLGKVDENGVATYDVRVKNKIINKIEREFKKSDKFKHLKNIDMEIFLFSYRRDLFKDSDLAVEKASEIGRERGGVKVYADNFRVFGYGQKGDDWLKVDYDRARSRLGVDTEVMEYVEEDRRPGLRLFMNRTLFGHVEFSRKDNPLLEVTINRERLIENDAFQELRKFVRLGIDFATVLYSNEIFKDRKEKLKKEEAEEREKKKQEEEMKRKIEEERKKAQEETEKIEKRKKEIEDLAKKAEEERKRAEEERRKLETERRKAEKKRRKAEKKKGIKPKKKIEKEIEEAQEKEEELLKIEEEAIKKEDEKRKIEEKIKRKTEEERKKAEEIRKKRFEEQKKAEEEFKKLQEERLRREKERLRRERSMLRVLASTGALVLIFQHELTALIEEMEDMSDSFLSILKYAPEKQQKSYKAVLESFNGRTDMVKELGEFLGLIVSQESRLEKKEWVLFPIINNVFNPFKWYLKEFGIEYNNTVPRALRTPKMYRSELVSVLFNLMSNAIKAVKGQQERHIEVTGYEKDGSIYIRFLDSGVGLDKSRWEEVFEPFESDSEPDIRFGAGTGLGLKIARDLARSYHGEIRFIDPPNGWKTCVEIALPKVSK
ncbi:MAG: ATP-binding protein [Candidatus Methanofastidiosia archaeon]|jgi:signal transduction histidine kinase